MMYCPHCQQNYPEETRFCLDDGATLSLQDPYKLVGRTLLEKYKIEALIGHGGMGAVYQARHLGINRRVAFKILMPHLASRHQRAIPLFIREAETAGSLKHPNIVDVSDAGRIPDEGLLYLVMEWLEGEDLDARLRKCERLGYTETFDLLRQIAVGLDAAHGNKIIHRDLKPSNIMLVKGADGSEQVKILDFGLAKSLEEDAGQVSEIMGTPHYASPEHYVKGGRIDHRTDLYSLGAILYRVLAGRPPFTGDSGTELIRQHLNEEPPPLSRFLPDVPLGIEQLIAQLLAKQPEDRPSTAGEVARIYEKALAVMPQKGGPVSADILTVKISALEPDAPPNREADAAVHSGETPHEAQPRPYDSHPHLQIGVPEKLPTESGRRSAPQTKRTIQAAMAATLIVAAAIAAYIFWPDQAAQREGNVAPPERVEVMSIALEIRPMSGGESRLIGLDPVPTGQEFRLRFSPRMRGYLYIIAPGRANAPTTWLTQQPHPDTGIKTNQVLPDTDFVFPGNTWFRTTNDLSTMAFTVIFSPTAPNDVNAPILPGFLAAPAMHRLTVSEQEELGELRRKVAAATPELAAQSGASAAKVTRLAAASSETAGLVMIDIPVMRR